MATKRTTEPSVPGEAFSQAKSALRVQGSAFDGEILQALAAAMHWIQYELSVQLINATWGAKFSGFPDESDEPIWLRPSPLVSITSIKYYDPDSVQQTWTLFAAKTTPHPGYVLPAYEQTYPAPARDIEVTYVCGWGTTWASIPPLIRQAVLLRTEELFRRIEIPELAVIIDHCKVGDEFIEYA